VSTSSLSQKNEVNRYIEVDKPEKKDRSSSSAADSRTLLIKKWGASRRGRRSPSLCEGVLRKGGGGGTKTLLKEKKN